MCRDTRNLAGGQPLSEHDVPCGTEKGVVETGRLKWPRAVGAAPGYALPVGNGEHFGEFLTEGLSLTREEAWAPYYGGGDYDTFLA